MQVFGSHEQKSAEVDCVPKITKMEANKVLTAVSSG